MGIIAPTGRASSRAAAIFALYSSLVRSLAGPARQSTIAACRRGLPLVGRNVVGPVGGNTVDGMGAPPSGLSGVAVTPS
eukprot:scaffold273_cov169-Ochromonas_danica.AAC.1